MKFALKGFFSILLLVTAMGMTQINASSSSCGTGTCTTSCQSSGDCTNLCNLNCCGQTLCNSGVIFGKTWFDSQSQGDNRARLMMGTEQLIHKYGSECFYYVGFLAVEYQQAFRNLNNIGKWFSTNGATNMSYGAVASAGSSQTDFDINALQFGVTGSGTIAFCPQSRDIIADLNMYFGLDEFFCGLWARIDIPITNCRRSLTVKELVEGAGSTVYPNDQYGDGFVSAAFIDEAKPMTAALKGTGFGTNNTNTFGAVPALKYQRVNGKTSDTNVAGIRFDLGYDLFRRERWHFAFSLDFVAPLGTTISQANLFEAMVGDSKRGQVGGTVNFGYELWNNCDATSNVTFYFDAAITTLIKKRVQRTIGINPDVANTTTLPAAAVWSHYLVLKKFDGNQALVSLERAANILTGDLKVGAGVIVDLAFLFHWACNCYFAGVGYEFWFRSREEVNQSCIVVPGSTYGLKGFTTAGTGGASNTSVAPATTIANNGADVALTSTNVAANTLPSDMTSTTYDYCRALHPSAYVNKVFGYLGYQWTECDWEPFILVGGEVGFGQQNRALSNWGVLVKGGISC